ncbi:MAG: NAD(P)/FAD-dependent oxidoreductase [Gemmatimonadetes bacterium]|nr:NAD(P)/FAD-dependent oxidoreductase [Gemmatimonadota bacterium]
MAAQQPHIVIVGGGFGGLYAARALASSDVRVTVIDRRNHHLFQPLLYQVASASLSPADIAAPIRHILRAQRNTEVILAEVSAVHPRQCVVRLADGRRVDYDYLLLATGAVDQYFGNDEWAKLAPGLKTIDDATTIRRRFLLAFEAAEQESDPSLREALLTFVVVGAGPTGVEMAGAFAEIARHTLARDFRNIDPRNARVVLVEGGERVLSTYHPELSARAKRQLERLGVEVRLGALVTSIEPDAVFIGEDRLPTRTVVWAAGVSASPLGATLDVPLDRMGRVLVEPDLSVPGHANVFVIGDLAAFTHQGGTPLAGTAPVAMQGAATAAANILKSIRGEPREAFRYRDRGNMATIGRAAAVAQVGRIRLHGLIAWLAWLFIHIFALIGFRNRLAVMMEWAWSYLTWQRGARLITGEVGAWLAQPGEAIGESLAEEGDEASVANVSRPGIESHGENHL